MKGIREEVLMAMIAFDAGDPKRIQHLLKVYQFAHLIGTEEGMEAEALRTLELAAIVHDIGIRPAEAAYGYQNGKLQEKLGPAYARELLEKQGIEEEVIQEVEFLVGHHHTFQGVDRLSWQILLEADFLVNSFEKGMSIEGVRNAMEKIFQTSSGIRLCKIMYGL